MCGTPRSRPSARPGHDATSRHATRFHQVARRCRSRNPEERVARREGVHRGAACLAMLRGAMTVLASPPPSPPKQPPPPPHPPTRAVSNPSQPPGIYSAPADTAASTATTLFTLPLASFSHPAAPRTPIVPLGGPSCFSPTNAILIGRKGGIQERDDLARAPRGDPPPAPHLRPFSVFSTFFYGFFSSSHVRIILRNVFPRDVLWLIFSLPRGRSFSVDKVMGEDATRGRRRRKRRCRRGRD